ncbi:hypothetical protein EPHNCH_1265 [Anaplasma phagocytophilum str. NCH-1]|uniref:Uncharacterized protein n=1 Tax=Anaplasma phagocytophilum str. NCH-1 TaxID=1359161 RepID=A0A0F3N531_ANAPH|nr:hypothetical protein EPHNCH_1265 [Anaplasma phagocytophilum str. NCH-1]
MVIHRLRKNISGVIFVFIGYNRFLQIPEVCMVTTACFIDIPL